MIRVLRIIARLNIGGPAIHATLLTERLAPERYESTLVTGLESPEEGNYLALSGRTLERIVVVPELGREIRGAQDVGALRRLVQEMRRLRPHIVHTHTAKAGTLGRIAAWLTRVPVVVHTYHGHVLRGYFSPAKNRAFVAVERLLARVTDRLIAVTPTVRAELLALGVGRPEAFAVVPLGLDLDRFARVSPADTRLRTELGLAASTPLVGIVARLVPIKAHEVFLDAARALSASRPDVHFVIAGDGERRRELETLAASLGLAACTHFLGWRGDLDTVYASLDVVALTSRNEGSPVALIEAMAAGRACVATSVGGVPDVVEDHRTGRLVPPDSPSSLAAVWAALLASPEERQRLGRTGRERVLARYGAARLVRDIEALYAELLTGKHPRR